MLAAHGLLTWTGHPIPVLVRWRPVYRRVTLVEVAGPAGEFRQAAVVSSANGGGVAPELDEAFDPGTLHTLRAKVLAQACLAGLSESRATDVVLAVHELAANAIRHGAGAGRLRVWNLVRELCCQVDDGDPPRTEDPGRHPAGSAAGAADALSRTLARSMSSGPGHGLWLVRQVADRMSMVSGPGGTCVRVAFNLS